MIFLNLKSRIKIHCQTKKLHQQVLQIEVFGKLFFWQFPQINLKNAKSFGKKLKNIIKE